MTARPYLLAAAALLALLALAALGSWPALQPDTARADEGQPVIHSVSPELPYCVLVRSPHAWARTLTLTGEGFEVDADRHLQLRFVGRGDASIHFGLEVEWVSSTEIRLDMALVEQHLREEERFPAYARLTGGYSDIPWESYAPLSDWSPAFLIAVDQDACPAAQPTPTPTPEPSPTPTPTPFPLTPPTRGLPGDLWADVVLGKPGFSEITPYEVAPHKLFNPGGVVVDRSADSGRAYVWDAGNSRVLGVDLAKCYAGEGPCSAEVVLGQPSGYDHSACNGDGGFQNFPSRAPAGPNTLCGLPDWALSPLESYTFVTMAIGNAGGLFVPDSYNNRVLKYDAPFERDAIADRVWGQSGFSGNLCNLGLATPTAETLCFHSSTNQNVVERYGSGVEFDADGNLWVADSGNNRVLRFPRDPTMDEVAQTADLALGQQDFESAGTGSGLAEFHAPSAVAIDRSGLLYVADSGNHRVLVFEPPFATGMPATGELDASFRFPTSIETAADGQGVWVNNTGGSTIELWSLAGKLGAVADPVSGRLRGGGIGVDNQGGLLAALSFEQDIVRFPTQAPGDDPGALNEGRRLFAKGQERNHIGTHGLMSAIGVAAWGDQLIVSDMRRLMFWNGLDSLTSGQPADGVVGDSFFVPEWPSCCGRIKADAAGRLWVLGSGWDYIDVYQLPLHERSAPLHTILTRNASFPVLGQSARITLGHGDRRGIKGITPVGQGEFLWLADTDNHRVLRIRDPLINPVVDVVLGQHDADGRLCNRTTDPGPHTGVGHHERGTPAADTLCFPGALSIDRLGNLYVSDHSLEIQGNRRLLVFLAESLPTDNISTIFAPSASKIFTDASDGTLSLGFQETLTGMIDLSPSRFYADDAATWETAFDSKNRMAVGYNAYAGPRFVGLYDDPLGPGLLPDAYLYDVGAMHYSAAFDDNDNLYVGDLNLARVLVYFNPFNDTSGPAPTPTPDSSLAPLPEYPVDIVSADPAPPFCVLRSSARPYETTLELGIDGLPEGDDFLLEFRKVTSAEILGPYSPSPQFIEDAGDGHSRVAIPQPPFWQRLWPHNRRVSLTARAIQSDGAPLSGWSPAFLLADDVESCGAALPTPTPTPTPTPEPTPTPMPEPTSTPTPEPTPTPIREPTPTPTREPTPTPTPEPTPTPQPALTPTPEPTPTSTLEPTPTPTLEPTPTPTLEPTPTPTLEPTPTPTLEPAPAPPTPEGDNRTLLRLGILAAGAALAAVIAALYIRRRRR